MKKQVLIFLFLTGCSYKGGAWFSKNFSWIPASFFKRALSCEKAGKKADRSKGFSQEEMEKLSEGVEKCLEENQPSSAVFILERLLKSVRKRTSRSIEIKKWGKKLAYLAFYSLKDYEKALKYYTRLLTGPLEPGEKFFFQYHIAESFFYLKKYSQALREVEKCFFEGVSKKQKKQASLFKGRVLIAQKNFKQALLFFKKQIDIFPEEEDLFREYLALVYEVQKDFLSAIKELEKINPSNSFVRKKMKQLMERQTNQPGS